MESSAACSYNWGKPLVGACNQNLSHVPIRSLGDGGRVSTALAVMTDPAHNLDMSSPSDVVLAAKALRHSWTVPPEVKAALLNNQIEIARDPDSSPRDSARAMKVILAAERLALDEEIRKADLSLKEKLAEQKDGDGDSFIPTGVVLLGRPCRTTEEWEEPVALAEADQKLNPDPMMDHNLSDDCNSTEST